MHLAIAQTGIPAAPLSPRGQTSATPPGEIDAFRQWMVRQGMTAEPGAEAGPSGGTPGNAESGSETQEATAPVRVQAQAQQLAGHAPGAAAKTQAAADVSEHVARGNVAAEKAAPENVAREEATLGNLAGNANASMARNVVASAGQKGVTQASIGITARVGEQSASGAQVAPYSATDAPASATAVSAAPENGGVAAGAADKSADGSGRKLALANSALAAEPAPTAAAPERTPVRGGEPVRKISGKEPAKVTETGNAAAAAWPGNATQAHPYSAAAQTAPPASPVAAAPVLPAPGVSARSNPVAHGASRGIPVSLPASPLALSQAVHSTPSDGPLVAVRPAEHPSTATASQRTAVSAAGPAPGTSTPVPSGSSSSLVPGTVAAASPHAGLATSVAPVTGSVSVSAHGSGAQATSTAPGAAFDRIDSGTAPQVLSRTPQRLDVGVRDPGLGWVEIRAHAGEGQVSATVSASAESHPALAAQLPAMRDYLASQQVRVDTLAAQPFQASADGHSSGQQEPSRSAPAAAGQTASTPEFLGEAEPESMSWIDVRV